MAIGEGNGNPLQYSCLENSMDGGGWWATVHAVAKSQTRLSNFTFTWVAIQFLLELLNSATVAQNQSQTVINEMCVCVPIKLHLQKQRLLDLAHQLTNQADKTKWHISL